VTDVALPDVVRFLDDFLRINEVPDDPNALNGLQVANGGRVARVVAAVDASLETIEHAGGQGARAPAGGVLLLVHHGLFWDGHVPLTGRRFRKVKALFDRDAALYSAHIPLDLHPEVGNNVELARRLGLLVEGWFGSYRGVPIGVYGSAPATLSDRTHLVAALDAELGTTARLIPGGPDQVRRIGIVTGAAGSMIAAARDAGVDTFISGEGAHHTYFDAMEGGVNVIYAGHYATEQVGVQALAGRLQVQFGLPWEFHRHPTGL
jgi:dinuclear metal center YbgI/SA1388 family protein